MSAILSNTNTSKSLKHLALVALPAEFGLSEAEAQQPLNNQTLSALMDALATADPTLKNQIEEILVDLAPAITETLLNGLSHTNIHVRSTIAMVLIRSGRSHGDALTRFANQPHLNDDARWAVDFVLEHLA